MKRGLITWDKTELPPDVFAGRMDTVRRLLAARDLPALAVYSDLWRSNQARFFSNYMPYFNRALLVVPRDAPAVLLCGLSPRVYGWIRSVTTIEDVRPAANFAKPLADIAAERKWTRIGALDFAQFPYDIHKAITATPLEVVEVDSAEVYRPEADEPERAMRRKAAAIAETVIKEELPGGPGSLDRHFVGRLERRFRRAGAEDHLILLTNGTTAPAPASGVMLEENFSISIAMEYRGHWVRLSRPHATDDILEACRKMWENAASMTGSETNSVGEFLGGSYPYQCGAGTLPAFHIEYRHGGKRLFYGDTIL